LAPPPAADPGEGRAWRQVRAGQRRAFLILEARDHAETRSARAYARLAAVETDRSCRRSSTDGNPPARVFERVGSTLGTAAVFSGASGVAPVTEAELGFLSGLQIRGDIASASSPA
jgi:3-oxoacyl-[acyl-carrier-protein] synthase II